MAKATIKIPNGPSVNIEGSVQEIQQLLKFYEGKKEANSANEKTRKSSRKVSKKPKDTRDQDSENFIHGIINKIKDCEDTESIETSVLDGYSRVNKTLLPLFIVLKYFGNKHGLTSGDINKILAELGTPIAASNISNTLSGSASKYVIGDKRRAVGKPVRYKLIRRGEKYFKSVLKPINHGK